MCIPVVASGFQTGGVRYCGGGREFLSGPDLKWVSITPVIVGILADKYLLAYKCNGIFGTFFLTAPQRAHPTKSVQWQNKARRYSFINRGNYAARELTTIRDGLSTGWTLTSHLLTTDKTTGSSSVHEFIFVFFFLHIKKSLGRQFA